MVLVHILSNDITQIEEVTVKLLQLKLIATANIDRDRERIEIVNGQIQKRTVNLLTCTTKALLFETINNFLKENYPNNLPELYSTAIVHMDWTLSKFLAENTEKV
jgi:uncharacterized protein involved in tolerance to divalent cations